MQNKLRSLVRVSAVATASLTLALSGATAMAASAPAVTATPSSGLSDGDTVAGTGFTADTPVFVTECAQVENGTVVCNSPDVKVVATTSDGKVPSTQLTVRKTFKGSTPDHMVWGTVDCSTVANGCAIGVAGDSAAGARTPITFKK
ncbi:enediyne antibiotic chromoprotein [Streptomyces celluloflavus]